MSSAATSASPSTSSGGPVYSSLAKLRASAHRLPLTAFWSYSRIFQLGSMRALSRSLLLCRLFIVRCGLLRCRGAVKFYGRFTLLLLLFLLAICMIILSSLKSSSGMVLCCRLLLFHGLYFLTIWCQEDARELCGLLSSYLSRGER